MFRCTPNSIFSWNFRIHGEGHDGTVECNWTGEQGAITADDVRFVVRKHGVLSGRWTLELDGKEVVSAQKQTAFTRTFEMNDSSGGLVLRAASPFTRSFLVERSTAVVATMTPDHAFTRRATIKPLGEDLTFTTICFSFWLAVLTWRRAAQSNS